MGYLNKVIVLMAYNSTQTLSDEQLIRSLALGESSTLTFIYKNCYPTIEKMVFKMNGSLDDAYDTFQDAVTILYEKAKADELHLTCKFSTYITAVAKHIWLNKLTKKKNQSFSILHDNMEDMIGINDDISVFYEFENNVSKLTNSLNQIGEPCKSVLTAFYITNKSMQDIASEFGYTNAENAKTQKYKCLNRLRKLFFNEKEVVRNERTY
ncbi:MAG TPA: sigma-70 family RNA polymerase sigma factor [Chitinophagaceae bacterium]|nr:sigma-70 family RNA polymerase sigma factor [Chitinophagaceae bacterium]